MYIQNIEKRCKNRTRLLLHLRLSFFVASSYVASTFVTFTYFASAYVAFTYLASAFLLLLILLLLMLHLHILLLLMLVLLILLLILFFKLILLLLLLLLLILLLLMLLLLSLVLLLLMLIFFAFVDYPVVSAVVASSCASTAASQMADTTILMTQRKRLTQKCIQLAGRYMRCCFSFSNVFDRVDLYTHMPSVSANGTLSLLIPSLHSQTPPESDR